MDVREKLTQIVRSACTIHSYCTSTGKPVREFEAPIIEPEQVGPFVAYLIANGVTVSPCKDRDAKK